MYILNSSIIPLKKLPLLFLAPIYTVWSINPLPADIVPLKFAVPSAEPFTYWVIVLVVPELSLEIVIVINYI